jgi:aquaporin Z
MGLAMAGTALGLVYSPSGKRSGAHFNPAMTFTWWRLGQIEARDALSWVSGTPFTETFSR